MAANQRPTASACRRPSSLSGTSMSRTSSPIRCSPAATAAARATLPALCPCRTSQRREGHLCLTGETKRQRLESSEQAFGLEPVAQIVGGGEEVAAHADGLGGLDVDQAVVDEQGVFGTQPEAVERQIVNSRIGLEQLDLARDDDVAEAAEKVALALVEGRPEVSREIGDRVERHAPVIERLDDGVDAGHGTGDGLAEAVAPGGDQMGVFGEFLGQLGCRLGVRAAGVERIVPLPQADIVDKAHPRLVVGDLADQEAVRVPAVEDVADVEDDGVRGGGASAHAVIASAAKQSRMLLDCGVASLLAMTSGGSALARLEAAVGLVDDVGAAPAADHAAVAVTRLQGLQRVADLHGPGRLPVSIDAVAEKSEALT